MLNSFQKDILKILSEAPEWRLQRKQIYEKLYDGYKYSKKYPDENTFNVTLYRQLRDHEYVKKDNVGHKQVFYYVQKEQQKNVKDLLEKEGIHEFVDKATPEQILNLRHFVEFSALKSVGSLGWVTTITWDDKGLPIFEDPRKEFPNGDELGFAILKKFREFVKANCEQCDFYVFPNEELAKQGAPIWCKYFNCELEPKAIPATYAEGCPVMKKS
jgi:hypothetical protein